MEFFTATQSNDWQILTERGSTFSGFFFHLEQPHNKQKYMQSSNNMFGNLQNFGTREILTTSEKLLRQIQVKDYNCQIE